MYHARSLCFSDPDSPPLFLLAVYTPHPGPVSVTLSLSPVYASLSLLFPLLLPSIASQVLAELVD